MKVATTEIKGADDCNEQGYSCFDYRKLNPPFLTDEHAQLEKDIAFQDLPQQAS